MPALNRLYGVLPVPMQHLAVSLAGWRARQRRFDARFRRLLAAAEERYAAGEGALIAHRDARIRAYVEHCVATVPFWQQRFAALGIAPGDIGGLDDLARLPLLDKAEVREQRDRFRSTAWPAGRCEARGTGGTTGASLRFHATADAVREQWAIWWRFWRRCGIPLHTWCGYFVGIDVVPQHARRPPFWRINLPRRQCMFSIFHLRTETLPHYVDELRRRQLPWLHGYPSVLALVAEHLLTTGADLGYRPHWVTTGAENLLAHQSEVIARAFGVRPRQHYGLAEGVANLSECDRGHLHVDEDFAAVEFVRRPNGTAALVGTGFWNPAFCLLRYDTGDLLEELPGGACDCGLPGRAVARIDGRREDTVLLPDGTMLGRLAHIFQDLDCLREAQIVQRRDRSIALRIVPVAGFDDDDARQVMAAARRRLGHEIPITLTMVEHLPRGPSGKLRFVVSELDPAPRPTEEEQR